MGQLRYAHYRSEVFGSALVMRHPQLFDFLIEQGVPFSVVYLPEIFGPAGWKRGVYWNCRIALKVTKTVVNQGEDAIHAFRRFIEVTNPRYPKDLMKVFDPNYVSTLGKVDMAARIEVLELSKKYNLFSFADPMIRVLFESERQPPMRAQYTDRLRAILEVTSDSNSA